MERGTNNADEFAVNDGLQGVRMKLTNSARASRRSVCRAKNGPPEGKGGQDPEVKMKAAAVLNGMQ
jgi:hypothetical protein